MSKQLPIIVGAIIVVLIVGLVAFTQFKKTSKPTEGTPAVSEPKRESGESLTKGSVKSLIAAGKSVTCTMDYSNDTSQTKGTVYVADKKVRGDFTSKVESRDMDSHMIQDGDWMYFWSSASNQGTKTKIDPNEPTPTPAAGQAQGADLNQEANMKCSAWSVDNSKFALPSNIQFMDMSQFMKPQASLVAGGTQGQSPCDSIADPAAKAQCQKAVTGY